MSAYIVSLVNVSDLERYKEYAVGAGAAAAKYGGKFLARGGEREVLEGELDFKRVVIAEFETLEAAKRFYHSPEYQEARDKRLGAADFNAIVTAGT